MEFCKQKGFIKKAIISIVIVILMNFSAPTVSRAGFTEAMGDLLLTLPDGLIWVMQSFFMGEGDVLIKVKSKDKKWEKMGSDGIAWIAWNMVTENGEFNLPNIKYTPYAIFHNDIPILNADFFSEGKEKKIYTYEGTNIGEVDIANMINPYKSEKEEDVKNYIKKELSCIANSAEDREKVYKYMFDELITNYLDADLNKVSYNVIKSKLETEAKLWISSGVLVVNEEYYKNGFAAYIDKFKENQEEVFGISETGDIISALKDEAQKIGTTKPYITFDFSKKFPENSTIVEEGWLVSENELNENFNLIKEDKRKDSVSVLKPIISKWYNILRTVAMVGLLSVLVYIGIRIVIYSASAQEKAKYKNMLKDWLIGLCLLFVLHFIMSFTMAVTGYITKIFDNPDMENMALIIPKDTEYDDGKNDALSKEAYDDHIQDDNNGGKQWKVNIVERIRFLITSTEGNDETISLRIAYTIMYIVIVIELIIFTFQYIKRVITMAILTLISPLIALTYPIDKITDGQAQGFNMWLKEYIFNALLQPMHLILYTIIMTSAVALIESNPIYAIVALGCMTPMEKLLRKIFGFNKAESVGAFGGAAGAAVVMSAVGSLQRLGKRLPKENNKDRDTAKLWENKKSIDAEAELLGATTGNSPIASMKNNNKLNNNKQNNNGKQKVSNTKEKLNTAQNKSKNSTTKNNELLSNINQNPRKKSIRSMKSNRKARLYALGQVGRSYGRKLTRSLKPTNVAKGLGRTAARVATGAAIGTVGLAAGIASGDLGKAVQYTSTAAIAGSTVGGALADDAINIAEDAKDTYQNARASVDEDYAEKKRYKEFKENEANIQYIESRYTDKEQRKEVMNMAKEAAAYGITDVEDISAVYEMTKQGYTNKQAIALGKMSKKMGDISDPEKYNDWKERLQETYGETGANTILKGVERFKKEKS